MKIVGFFLFFLFFFHVDTKAQYNVEMDSINTYINANYDKLDSLYKGCDTRYALVKLDVNQQGRISTVAILNEETKTFANFFSSLKRMKFNLEGKKAKTIVFIYVVYSQNDCKPEDMATKKTVEVLLPEMLGLLSKQIAANPKTEYGGIISSYIGHSGKK